LPSGRFAPQQSPEQLAALTLALDAPSISAKSATAEVLSPLEQLVGSQQLLPHPKVASSPTHPKVASSPTHPKVASSPTHPKVVPKWLFS
jgi:hypothetical protein